VSSSKKYTPYAHICGLAGRSRANEYASIGERMNMHINCANEYMTLAYKAAAATMREWTKPNTIIIS